MLIRTCRRIGELVPEQVAMLGVDNDELQCRQANPPLSSIQVAHEEIGYNAARLLESLMRGRPAPPEPIRVQPIGVVTRASTDILAIADSHVAAAVRFINQHAHSRINVADVVQALAIGRRVLEYRFRRAMGRSLLDEIHRVCTEQAKMLLVNTNKPLPEVAIDAGFRDNQHLWTVFRKITGVSPAAYRKSQRT
jgi:LacI family transcriptional regulator